ncbi:MAG: serine hydrolase, partial [Bacteroidales bacterium]|nr:serine hydrolase [Bacteroidales bacterium]
LSAYIPGLCNTDKSKITVKDAMMHQAKLTPWIPFYTRTTRTDSLRQVYYSAKFSKDFTLQVTEEMYLRGDYRDTIFDEIYKSPLLSKKEYRYSDLGLILCGEMISKIVGTSLDNYARESFYRPLGANYTCFNPLNYFDISRIAPTENDTIFRKKQVHGYVHDQAAAMFGGVAGHAGLFSNAIDMAKLCQMLLNKGEYGGVRYIQSSTIELFTKTDEKSPKNRRGIGFDKPIMSDRGSGPACKSASASSYGHSGFTGTYFWVDPEEDLVYVFISNRVYPIAENNKIISLGIRTNLHQLMYESIITDSVAQK